MPQSYTAESTSMAARSSLIRMVRFEEELNAERKRSAELHQAHATLLDRNRLLTIENATLRTDLRHLNETVVPGLQRSLQEVKDQLSQERMKLEKHLRNEARSARNREMNALLGAVAEDMPAIARKVVKRELVEREDSRPPTAETPPPDESNHAHTVNAIPDIRRPSTSSNENVIGAYAPINENCEEGPHADEGLLPVDQRRRGTTKLLSLTVEEPAAPPPATRQRLPRKNASASSKIHRVELRPTSKYPHRAIQKPIPMARRGNPNAAPYSNPVERPKTGRRLDPTKQAASTNRWAATDELCAHRNCRNPYENESIIPEGEEIAWVECDRCSEWYHCICVLGRNRSPRAGSEFICNARRCL